MEASACSLLLILERVPQTGAGVGRWLCQSLSTPWVVLTPLAVCLHSHSTPGGEGRTGDWLGLMNPQNEAQRHQSS